MREKINKLARGIIDDSTPLVCVEPTSIKYDLIPGETVRFEIKVTSENDVYVKGLAYSSDARIKVVNGSFGGANIKLYADATMRVSDEDEFLKGSIDLVTNGGEFSIPFVFHKSHRKSDNLLSGLQSEEDFERLVNDDREQALKLFDFNGFINAPFMADLRRKAIYAVLKSNPDRGTALSQFLYATSDSFIDESRSIINNQAAAENEYSVNPRFARIHKYKKMYFNYAKLRLAFEMDLSDKEEIIENIIKSLQGALETNIEKELISMYLAEAYTLCGREDDAKAIVDSLADYIRNNRDELFHEYFLLEYINIVLYGRREKAASLLRLCKKFIEENNEFSLFFIVLKLDDELIRNDIQFHSFLCDMFSNGCRSPWIYYYYCTLLNDHPEYLYAPKEIDNQALNFGNKYHLLNDNIHNSVVSASCIAYIKSDKRTVSVHKTFKEGIDLGLNINGLFEYYLYSLPKDDSYVISDEVLNHFIERDNLDYNTKTKLYSNVVRFKNKNTSIYKAYEPRIIDFALNQLKVGKFSNSLIEIYKGVLKPELIDAEAALAYFEFVNSYIFAIEDNSVLKYVVVTYPQASNIKMYPIAENKAVLPVFSSEAIIMFQDAYGNRYSNIAYKKEPIIYNSSIKSAAEKLASGNELLRLSKDYDLIIKKTVTDDDIKVLEKTVYDSNLNKYAKALVISKLIHYYSSHTAAGYNPEFLLRINKNELNRNERQDLCNAYITCGCYKEAYEMLNEFGLNGVSSRNLRELCSKLILEDAFTNDELLLNLSALVVEQNVYDNIILDYLCEHFNGTTIKMYHILEKSIKAHVDTYDLEERLLAQLIFINDNTYIDTVFTWYAERNKASQSIVRAYFTFKCIEYFFNSKQIDKKIFLYLENSISGSEDYSTVPLIYILALTRYLSRLENLTDHQKHLAKVFTYILLEKNLKFPYLKRFSKYFELPADFLETNTVVYQAEANVVPVFKSIVMPTESEYVLELADNTIFNLYLKSKTLFADEQWHYEILQNNDNGVTVLEKGVLNYSHHDNEVQKDRFDDINQLVKHRENSDTELIKEINDYIIKSEVIKSIFK